MTISIIGKELHAFDTTVATIEAWYDRHTKDYCILKLNKDGYQIGDAIRTGDKASKAAIVAALKEEYKI